MKRRCTVAVAEKKEREKAGALRTQDRNEKQETIDALPVDSPECNDLSGAQKFLCCLSLVSLWILIMDHLLCYL